MNLASCGIPRLNIKSLVEVVLGLVVVVQFRCVRLLFTRLSAIFSFSIKFIVWEGNINLSLKLLLKLRNVSNHSWGRSFLASLIFM